MLNDTEELWWNILDCIGGYCQAHTRGGYVSWSWELLDYILQLIAAGGFPGPSNGATEEYNGEVLGLRGGNLNTARTNAGSTGPTGSQNAALCFGGNTPGQTSNNEEYNGTAWSEQTNYPSALSYLGYAGTQTACIGFNGYPGGPGVTAKSYDGTNWSSIASLSVGRLNYHQNGGTANAAFVAGGEGTSGLVNATEEFSVAGATKTFTTS